MMKKGRLFTLFIAGALALGTQAMVGNAYIADDDEEGQDTAKTDSIVVTDSFLEMPNGFSPNGDGKNDTYHAKRTFKNIVDFHAIILNRWGQKLYEWRDVNGEWDGNYNGSPVKDGVYYVLVHARGADGREYNIRRDVNLLRKKQEDYTGTTGGE